MMNKLKALEPEHIPNLSDLFTDEQEAQLARLLAELMAHGWGSVEIEIIEHKMRFFIPKRSIPIVYGAEK